VLITPDGATEHLNAVVSPTAPNAFDIRSHVSLARRPKGNYLLQLTASVGKRRAENGIRFSIQ
jgi:hypothetical protein